MTDRRQRRNPRPWYATAAGKRYHSSPYCNGLNAAELTPSSTVRQLSTREAQRRGLTPCATCQPPAFLYAVP